MDSSSEDALITRLIGAVTALFDGWSGILGLCLINQTWRQDFDAFCRCLPLPLFPVGSIASVKYDDAGNVEQTVDSGSYELLTNEIGAYVRFKDDFSFPAIDDDPCSVRVAFVAGYGAAASNVPEGIRHAMLMMVEHFHKNRGAVALSGSPVVLPFAVDALLTPVRRIKF